MLIPSTKAGFLGKTYGTDGCIKMHCEDEYVPFVLESNFLFLDHNGQYIPYRVMRIENGNNLLVCFTGHESKELAQELVGKEVFLDEWNLDLSELQVVNHEHALVGLQVRTSDTVLGRIKEIEEMPTQLLAKIESSSGQIHMIPIIDQWIVTTDETSGVITMDLPDGILDLE